MKMCVKYNLVRVWGILVLCSLTFASTGWKPIVPPPEYFATKPTTCVADCGVGYQYPVLSENAAGTSEAETRITSIIASHPISFPKDDSLPSGNSKLGLNILKPPVRFFIQGENEKPLHSSPATTYQEIMKKTPTSTFVHFKRFGPPLTIKNPLYLKGLELVESDEGRHVSDVSQSSGSAVQIMYVTPSTNYLGSELKAFESFKVSTTDSRCSVYKVSFRQDLYYQYLQYKVKMPDLLEFTVCMWLKIHNVGHEHSLFSYAAKPKKNGIHLWVSNLHEPALFNMKILGQTIFRLNYPIKLYKWHHTCQSWNGNTGEWQVWVDGKRIGRGFHNLLVGHEIEGGGIAMSGQQHRHFSKGFQAISQHFKSVVGLEGEITMLQLYKIALTAGKAYNDHRNHHSHFTTTTPEAMDLSSEEPEVTTHHPLLENGQLKTHVNILELIKSLKYAKDLHPHLHLYAEHFSHPYESRISLPFHGEGVNYIAIPNHSIFKRDDAVKSQTSQAENNLKDQETESQKVAFVKILNKEPIQVQVEKVKFTSKEEKDDKDDENIMVALLSAEKSEESQIGNNSDKSTSNSSEFISAEQISKEDSRESNRTSKFLRIKRQNTPTSYIFYPSKLKRVVVPEQKTVGYVVRSKQNRPSSKKVTKITSDNEKEATKRHIIFGDPFTGLGTVDLGGHNLHATLSHLPSFGYTFDELSHLDDGFSDEGHQSKEHHDDDNPLNAPETHNEYRPQKELAENEVRKIMEICSGCHTDPFNKVAVISWRSTPKKIYSGALFLKAKPECEHF